MFGVSAYVFFLVAGRIPSLGWQARHLLRMTCRTVLRRMPQTLAFTDPATTNHEPPPGCLPKLPSPIPVTNAQDVAEQLKKQGASIPGIPSLPRTPLPRLLPPRQPLPPSLGYFAASPILRSASDLTLLPHRHPPWQAHRGVHQRHPLPHVRSWYPHPPPSTQHPAPST